MIDRVDRYLDGALEQVALGADERAEAELLEHAIEETRAFVDARPAPDLTATVMGRVAAIGSPLARHRPSGAAGLLARLWAPREVSFSVRPAFAVLAVVALAAIALVPRLYHVPQEAPQAVEAEAAPSRLLVQFRLQAPEASTVRLAGSFTNWQPEYELHQSAPGIWTITVPLPLGVHDYSFVVDGRQWVADPYAQSVDDGFGGTNSRISLLPPGPPRS